jgi:hypothetical protein
MKTLLQMEMYYVREYTPTNDFDLQLVLVSCPKGQVKKKC